jgi:hypothetical protein
MMSDVLIRTLFADLRKGEYIELRLIHGDLRAKGNPRFFSSVDGFLSAAHSAGEDVNVYYGVAPRREQKSTKEAVERVQALWADIDADKHGNSKPAAYNAMQGYILPPSFVIDTGFGYHAYWLLAESVTPAEAELANQELMRATGGDNVWDAGRVMRVPGTMNVKHGRPVPSTLVRDRPDLKYHYEDLVGAARISDACAWRIKSGDRKGFRSRSERDWNVISELLSHGLSDQVVFVIFEEHPCGDKYRQDGKRYLQHTVERARLKLKLPVPPGPTKGPRKGVAAQIHRAFREEDEGLFYLTPKGRQQVSTFIPNPTRILEGELGDTILCDIEASGYTWENVPLTRRAFTNVSTLLRELPIAAWQWVGNDKQVRLLLPYLMYKLREKGLPRAKYTTHIGRWRDFWVAPNAVLTIKGAISPDESPIVYLPTGREHPRVSYPLPPDEEYHTLVKQIFHLYPDINVPHVVWPILGWYMAAPYKALLEEGGVRFPVLSLYGTRGSGKTATLLRVMQRLSGIVEPRSYDCNTTQFVMLSLLASTNGIPISFSEFRRASLSTQEYSRLTRYLLLAYDVGRDARGRPDQTTQDYDLSAPFTLDGEDAVSDPASKERVLMVNLRPETIEEGSLAFDAYNELVLLPLERFMGRYLMYTLESSAKETEEEWMDSFRLMHRTFDEPMPDRVRRNMAISLFGYQMLHAYLRLRCGVELPEATTEFVEEAYGPGLRETVIEGVGRTRLLADDFVEEVINHVATPEQRVQFIYKYIPELNEIWIHLSTALSWWIQKRRREGRDYLDRTAIKTQLKERDINTSQGRGQYVVGSGAADIHGTTKWVHKISIDSALEAGLDIPDSLKPEQVMIIHVGED